MNICPTCRRADRPCTCDLVWSNADETAPLAESDLQDAPEPMPLPWITWDGVNHFLMGAAIIGALVLAGLLLYPSIQAGFDQSVERQRSQGVSAAEQAAGR